VFGINGGAAAGVSDINEALAASALISVASSMHQWRIENESGINISVAWRRRTIK